MILSFDRPDLYLLSTNKYNIVSLNFLSNVFNQIFNLSVVFRPHNIRFHYCRLHLTLFNSFHMIDLLIFQLKTQLTFRYVIFRWWWVSRIPTNLHLENKVLFIVNFGDTKLFTSILLVEWIDWSQRVREQYFYKHLH